MAQESLRFGPAKRRDKGGKESAFQSHGARQLGATRRARGDTPRPGRTRTGTYAMTPSHIAKHLTTYTGRGLPDAAPRPQQHGDERRCDIVASRLEGIRSFNTPWPSPTCPSHSMTCPSDSHTTPCSSAHDSGYIFVTYTVESRLYVQVGTQKFGCTTEGEVQVKIIFCIRPSKVFWTRQYRLDVQTSGTYN